MHEINQFNQLKILRHSDRINEILRGDKMPPPVSLNLDITNRCNHKCVWCYVENYIRQNPIEMKARIAMRIIAYAKQMGVKAILFTGGGEPTIHKEAFGLMEFAYGIDLDVGLTTNGSMLDVIAENVSLEIFKYIRVSIDAASPEMHKKLHRCNDGEFMKIMTAAKKIAAKKPKGFSLGYAFLAVPENILEIPAATTCAEMIGFDYISIRPSVFGHRLNQTQHEMAVNMCEIAEGTPGIKVYPIRKRFRDLKYGKPDAKCLSTPLVAVVTADAKLNLCCQYRGQKEWQWGDLENGNFRDYWGNEDHRRLIKKAMNASCPVCRMTGYNEIIEEAFIRDNMHFNFL